MNPGLAGRLASGACALACLVSCGDPRGDGAARGEPRPARHVEVAHARMRPMERVVAVSGSLAAQETSTLSAKVPGRLARLAVDVGSRVRQGDLIAEVEPRDYELRLRQAAGALAQARAALGLSVDGEDDTVDLGAVSVVRQAKAVLDESAKTLVRVRSLTESAVVSAAELDTAEVNHAVAETRLESAWEEARIRLATLAQRRAEHDLARKALEDTKITAPFPGAVQSRPASPGEYVAAGTPIATLVQSDPLRLRLEVPERESALVAPDQTVRLVAEGQSTISTGRIVRLSPALNERARTLLVEAEVPNDGTLRPGLFARASIILDARDQGLAVPLRALVTFAGIEKVLTVENGKAVERRVTTGRRGPDWVEITSGIDPGAVVILDAQGIQSGQPVSVTESDPRSVSSG